MASNNFADKTTVYASSNNFTRICYPKTVAKSKNWQRYNIVIELFRVNYTTLLERFYFLLSKLLAGFDTTDFLLLTKYKTN